MKLSTIKSCAEGIEMVGSNGAMFRSVLCLLSGITCSLSAFAYDTDAATAAANSSVCDDIRPFYWEIGGASGGPIISGQVGGTTYSRSTGVALASGSKWVFGAYVVQRYNGIPGGISGAKIVKALNMRAGYTHLNDDVCTSPNTFTVTSCFHILGNDRYDAAADGEFFYDSGNAQSAAAAATLLDLGSKTRSSLLAEVDGQLGLGPSFEYLNTPVSSGLGANAEDYASFLQKIMDGTYVISSYLSFLPVPTYPCGPGLTGCSPAGSVDFHYSLHHWIEDNTGGTLPNGKTLGPGDAAHSSAGAFGFYPWITNDLQYYGIISRQGEAGTGSDSLVCGRAIRAAFLGE
jgi:hypothetical protein